MFKHIKSELEVTENLENPNSGWVLGLKSIKIELEIKPCVHERITKFKISIQNENFYIMFFWGFPYSSVYPKCSPKSFVFSSKSKQNCVIPWFYWHSNAA